MTQMDLLFSTYRCMELQSALSIDRKENRTLRIMHLALAQNRVHLLYGFPANRMGCNCCLFRAFSTASGISEKSATMDVGFFSQLSWRKGTK